MARTYLNVDGIKSPNGLSTKTTSGTTTDANFSAPVDGMLAVDTSNHKLYYRSGGTWHEPTGTTSGGTAVGAGGSASIPFTDGDTLRRVTITDANVTSTSKIVGSVRRPDTANDSVDQGYLYTANVVAVGTGFFDVLITVADWGTDDPVQNPPNETVQFVYTINGGGGGGLSAGMAMVLGG
jgi:hypothetical protein